MGNQGTGHGNTNGNGESGLLARVRRLEDIEAIQQVQHRYGFLLDEGVGQLGLAQATAQFKALFTEDTNADFGGFGVAQGRDGLGPIYEAFQASAVWTIHYITNPVIEVNGDHATGKWNFHAMTIWAGKEAQGAQPLWGRYREEFTRTPAGFLIRSFVLVFDAPPAP
jgi:hypothetical protein